jgi:outer membrane lipoprotein-sorting protein
MLRLAFTGTLAVLVLAGARPARAEEDKDAKAVIARAVEAQGGAAALKKYQASTVKIKGKVHTPFGDGDMAATLKVQLPDKIRFDMKLTFGGADVGFVSVVDGDKGWLVANGETQELSKEMLAETRDQLHAGQVTDLRVTGGKGVKLSSLGETKVGDKSAVGVRVSCAGHRDVNLYFDKGTGLLLKSETRGKDGMTGEEYTEEKVYGDYKKVNGLMVAHKVDATRDGKPRSESVVTEVTLEEKLPDSTFAKP